MKRTRLKKRGGTDQARLERELWQLCRRVAETRWPNKCFTCDREVSGSNRHLGHFIPKGNCGAYLKYDMRNLRWQCYHCNINLGGAGAEFYRRLVESEGQDYVDTLFRDKQRVVKATDRYSELATEYELFLLSVGVPSPCG